MEAASFKDSELRHGSPQRSVSRNARPSFVPKQPPRPRQRARPASEMGESNLYMKQRPLASGLGKFSEEEAQHKFSVEERTQQRDSCTEDRLSAACQGDLLTQSGNLPRERSSLLPTPEKKSAALWQREPIHFSRSWHRNEDRPRQRGALPAIQEQLYRPRQKRGTLPLFQGQACNFSVENTSFVPSFKGPSLTSLSEVQEPRALLDTKAMFLQMWPKLESAIESRERTLMSMKVEMEKSLSQVKDAKAAALKEKEEAEACITGVQENLQTIISQTTELKRTREVLEQISTDLSVQVAELNCLLQQSKEQQRTLQVLESLKNHYKSSENIEDDFMDMTMLECEVKLAAMERELVGSRQASEVLEQAALKRLAECKEIEFGCTLVNEAFGNLSFAQSKCQINSDWKEKFSKTSIDAGPSRRMEEQEKLGQAGALKRPKLEPSS